ncbi:Protein of unknown function, partial [Cotesia congregata]
IPTSVKNFSRYNFEDVVNIELFTNKTVYGDSGWYGCVNADDLKNFKIANETAITPYNFINSGAKWIYVFVKSNTNHFVGSSDLLKTFRVKTGDDILIPCRPTSPYFEIKLTKDEQGIKLNERINFDPKRGFEIKNADLKDNGFYQCIIKVDYQALSYYVHVARKQL